ncbi:MAG: hypothetical protein BWY31_01600 [Lentisphaerae bacterium ADurb.Bin242]|nr:MAG: hypothetical protein BWY31_01600 [Lentisphaerae bacterium ADurb.Bin242]
MDGRKGAHGPVKVLTEDHMCITPEKISAQLDGEEEFSNAEKKHLRNCKKCHALQESYKLLDDAVTKSLDMECPPAAQFRIRKRITRHIRENMPIGKRPVYRYAAWTVRAAAVFALFSMTGYLFFVDNPFSTDPAKIAAASPEEVRNVVPASLSPAPSPYKDFTGNSIDVRHTRFASTESAQTTVRFTEEKPVPKAEKIALIPSRIKHVWVYSPTLKTAEVERLLRTAIGKANVPLKGIKLAMNPKGEIRVLLEINRYQAVMLTRELASRSFQLLSSQQPQPEQKLFTGNGRELVNCELVLIPREIPRGK